MVINRLAGYQSITLSTGKTVELKFCNGSNELFARSMDITLLDDMDKALSTPVVDGKPQHTTLFLKAIRLYTYAAALYVCLAENKPIDFNEWEVAEWVEEVGLNRILSAIDLPEVKPENPNTKKKKEEPKQEGPKQEGPKTFKEYKAYVLGRLNLLPEQFYDLTPAETTGLLEGVFQREVFALKNTRIVASLIRNAHFDKPEPATKFMPLPGDEEEKTHTIPPSLFIKMFAEAFRGQVTVTKKGKVVEDFSD